MKAFLYGFAAVATMAALYPLPRLKADDKTEEDRAHLIGSWVQNGGSQGWVIDGSSDKLHVTETENSSPVAEFQCNTDGHDCDVKIGGHKASVSMYYNGSALVQFETRGGQIVKRRFSVLPSGNAMKVEVTPMTGAKTQTEELEFNRSQSPATAKK